MRLPLRIDCERPHFAHDGSVEVQSARRDQVLAGVDDGEIAYVLRYLEFGARQHDAFRGVVVDQLEQRRDIGHRRLPDLERSNSADGIDDRVGGKSADHATNLVPNCSPARTRESASGLAPGAIRTWRTPCSNAAMAAVNFACMPPLATPSTMRRSQSATINSAHNRFAPSSTPSTSVRNTSWSTSNPA